MLAIVFGSLVEACGCNLRLVGTAMLFFVSFPVRLELVQTKPPVALAKAI